MSRIDDLEVQYERMLRERAAALAMVSRLERILTSTGGQLSALFQEELRCARKMLEETGVRCPPVLRLYAPVAPSWASDPPPWERG